MDNTVLMDTFSRKRVALEEEAGNLILHTQQDLEPLLEYSKAMYNATDERAHWKGDMHHVAHIPAIVVDELFRTGEIHDEGRMKKWLNDHYNQAFRTRPGVV